MILTFEPSLVSLASSLLAVILGVAGDSLSRLYATGVFYFLLAYAGSNLEEAAHLLQQAHLRQAHRCVHARSPA